MSLLAFQGLAAHRLAPLDDDPGGAAYAVDLSWMCGFAVRPGLEPYGACAYFAADRTLLRVCTSHDDTTHRPTDASWEDAKWRWRSALFAAVTVADHLGATHFLASNLMVTVTQEQLPENHPLRRFLKPAGADTIVAAGGASATEPRLPRSKIFLIAMIANGLGPARLVRSVRKGAQLDALRGGPLDKRGTGSRILQPTGRVDENELARLDQFAADKVDASGVAERGLGIDELRTMMDANFARAAGKRRRIDRALMNGEWPILLRVMGKTSLDGRYLSLTELRTLFVELRLPPRITERLTPTYALDGQN